MNRIRAAVDWLMKKALAHTAEEGSRQLVWAAVGGERNKDKLRGAYISASQVQEASDVVLGEDGRNLQNKIWVCDLVSCD
jgi:retinol dehydrogenase-12